MPPRQDPERGCPKVNFPQALGDAKSQTVQRGSFRVDLFGVADSGSRCLGYMVQNAPCKDRGKHIEIQLQGLIQGWW